jgi:hypothetical protein
MWQTNHIDQKGSLPLPFRPFGALRHARRYF